MKEFSPELYKKHQDGNYDKVAFDTLQKLKKLTSERGVLFEEKEKEQFEFLKLAHPEEWELLQNQEAFQDLTPEQKRQVAFKSINGHEFDPENSNFHYLED